MGFLDLFETEREVATGLLAIFLTGSSSTISDSDSSGSSSTLSDSSDSEESEITLLLRVEGFVLTTISDSELEDDEGGLGDETAFLIFLLDLVWKLVGTAETLSASDTAGSSLLTVKGLGEFFATRDTGRMIKKSASRRLFKCFK